MEFDRLQPAPANFPPLRPPGRDRVRRNYALGAAAAVLIIIGFTAGFYYAGTRSGLELPGSQMLGQVIGKEAPPAGDLKPGQVIGKEAPPPYALKDVDFADFWKIWTMVKDRHVDHGSATDVKMFYGAIGGMVASLDDPYSVFFDPEFAKKFADELSGTFDGIGAEIGVKKNQLIIIAPLPGTPADKAGLKAGDKIYAIDGRDTSGMFVDEAVSLIRGQKGTEVKLLIGREGWKESKEIPIIRNTIVVESVKWRMEKAGDKRVAVIDVSRFNEDTVSGFSQAVRSVLLENPDGLVLDLRNNPGGFLETAVKMAGEWVPNDVIVKEKISDGQDEDYRSDGGARLADLRTVVLVNGGSASASEIVAGALQDYGKATIVGEQTFGKGSVQDYTEFDDGSALKLTVALWYTPKGRSIDKDGIVPDVEIKNTPEDFDNDRDPQLDKAMELAAQPISAVPAAVEAAKDAPEAGTN